MNDKSMTQKRPVSLMATIALTASVSFAANAGEFVMQKDKPGKGPQAQASGEYWTTNRMTNAQPFLLPAVEGSAATRGSLMQDPALFGDAQGNSQPGTIMGSGVDVENTIGADNKPNTDGGSTLIDGSAADTLALAGGIQTLADGYDYPPPHTTFPVYGILYKAYPYRAVGRVFFTSGGLNYSCSGSSIGGRAVLTAGHCVSNGGGTFHSNWRFAPNYDNGVGTDGLWTSFWKATFSDWHYSYSFCRDVGFAAVKDIKGVKLSERVGALGFAYNFSPVQHWNMFGYPGNWYNGQKMIESQASFSRLDSPNGCTPFTVGMGTTQGGGTSGGPRIMNFWPAAAGAVNYANGVNSYIYTNRPFELFSPYFDSSVKNLRDMAVAQ